VSELGKSAQGQTSFRVGAEREFIGKVRQSIALTAVSKARSLNAFALSLASSSARPGEHCYYARDWGGCALLLRRAWITPAFGPFWSYTGRLLRSLRTGERCTVAHAALACAQELDSIQIADSTIHPPVTASNGTGSARCSLGWRLHRRAPLLKLTSKPHSFLTALSLSPLCLDS
jgi:hypothetical protein